VMSGPTGLLAPCAVTWAESCRAMEACTGGDTLVTKEEVERLVAFLDRAVTKLGASGVKCDETEVGLLHQPAAEVIKCHMAVAAALQVLYVSRVSGRTLREDIKSVGNALTVDLVALGSLLTQDNEAAIPACGKCIEKIKKLVLLPLDSKVAVKRRLLRQLAQIKDTRREVVDWLAEADGDLGFDDEDEDGIAGADEEDKRVGAAVVDALEGIQVGVKEVLHQITGLEEHPDPELLERFLDHSVAKSTDQLSMSVLGGVDPDAVTAAVQAGSQALEALASALKGVGCDPAALDGSRELLAAVTVALEG